VGAVGDEDPGSFLPLFSKYFRIIMTPVSSRGPGGGLEREGLHAEDFRKAALQLEEKPQVSLAEGRRRQGVEGRESLKGGRVFVDLRIVFHGARSEGVKPEIDAEVPPGKMGVMADHVDFGQLRQVRVLAEEFIGKEFLQGNFRHVAGRRRESTAAGTAFFEEQFHGFLLIPQPGG
jgi:hypothetical protein